MQVITFGHPLSEATKAYLTAKYPDHKVFQTFVHLNDPKNIIRATDGITRKLVNEGCDLSGRTDVLIVLPGMSALTATILAVLTRAMGRWPSVLYALYVKGEYQPLPDLEELDLQRIGNDLGRRLRDPEFLKASDNDQVA